MKGVPHVPDEGRPLREGPPRDVAIARLAERQHGVVTVGQLRSLGLGARGARHREASGRLHRIHRRVYAVGRPDLTDRGRWMAAVLAYGNEAALSHRAAAAHRGLRPSASPKIDVTVPRRSVRSRPGIHVHASETLRREDVTAFEGIPCTTVARTLLDLADVLNPRGVERAVEQAEVLRLFDLQAVEDVLARATGRRGAGVLRAAIGNASDNGVTASELEEAFLELCRGASLPQPAVNAWLTLDDRAIKADFLWRTEHLIVETDGRASHGTPQAFERDRRRDQLLTLAGFKILRFTWRQVRTEPDAVAGTIGALL
jgi:very-short-patch-repair endonuclease